MKFMLVPRQIFSDYRDWTSFTSQFDEAVAPSPGFQKSYENVLKAFHMGTAAGSRVFLNLFLGEIVQLPEFQNALRIFPGIDISVESDEPKKRKLKVTTDYTVGFGKDIGIFDNSPSHELYLLVTEVKKGDIDEGDFWLCVAQTATLYKSLNDAGKTECSVWGVLSNATRWKFIYNDEDGYLWRTMSITSIFARTMIMRSLLPTESFTLL